MKIVLLFHLTLMVIATPVFGYELKINNQGSVFNSSTVVVTTGGNSADGGAGDNGADGSTDGADGQDGADGVSGPVINGKAAAEVRIEQTINGVVQEPLIVTKEASSGQAIEVRAESRVINGSSSKKIEINIASNNSTTAVIASSSSVRVSVLKRLLGSASSLQAGFIRQSLQNIINKFIRIFFNAYEIL